jgi:hypothetical protein
MVYGMIVNRVMLTHSQDARLTNLFLVWAEFQSSLQRRVLLFGNQRSTQLDVCAMQFGRLVKAISEALGPSFHDALLSECMLVLLSSINHSFHLSVSWLPLLGDSII